MGIYKDVVILPCKIYAQLYKLAAIGITCQGCLVLYGMIRFKRWIRKNIFVRRDKEES